MGEKIISKNFLAGWIVVIAILSWIGNFGPYSFTDHYWFEETLHVIGGLWVAAALLCFFNLYPQLFNIQNNFVVTFFLALSATAFIGLVWEFFEFLTMVSLGGPIITLGDTLLDLFLDIVGALILVLVWRYNRQRV